MDETKKEKLNCPDCGKKMYQLSDSLTSTYVCPECGRSVDAEYVRSDCNQSPDGPDSSGGEISIDKLFNNAFMKKYTDYDNLTDFIINSELVPKDTLVITYEIFENIPREEFNEYIRSNTLFGSWNDMFDKATSRYLKV
jgi:DNA-directed RNA polymerase subunit RPC12/RpoP